MAAKMLVELREAVADRPAHARRLARLETITGAAMRAAWHPDTIYAALHQTEPTDGCSDRVAEALLTDLRWIIGAGNDREHAYPSAYAARREADSGRRKAPAMEFKEPRRRTT